MRCRVRLERLPYQQSQRLARVVDSRIYWHAEGYLSDEMSEMWDDSGSKRASASHNGAIMQPHEFTCNTDCLLPVCNRNLMRALVRNPDEQRRQHHTAQ